MEVCQLECERRKGTVFGMDLSMLPRDNPDDVPFVVLQCTSEIESRALSVQVLFTIGVTKMLEKKKTVSAFCFHHSLRGCIA